MGVTIRISFIFIRLDYESNGKQKFVWKVFYVMEKPRKKEKISVSLFDVSNFINDIGQYALSKILLSLLRIGLINLKAPQR